MKYRMIGTENLIRALFAHFIRRQEVTKCWRREAGEWVIRDAPFTDDWSEEDYAILRAADFAGEHGARKLYLSALSAVESQAFYRSMGCVEATEYSAYHTEKESFDCQMEYRILNNTE